MSRSLDCFGAVMVVLWVIGFFSLHGRYAILVGPRQRATAGHGREIYAHWSSIQLICRHCRIPLIETFLWRIIATAIFAIDRGSDRELKEWPEYLSSSDYI